MDDLKGGARSRIHAREKKMAVVVDGPGRVDAFIYRTAAMPDREALGILDKYGIDARVGCARSAVSSLGKDLPHPIGGVRRIKSRVLAHLHRESIQCK